RSPPAFRCGLGGGRWCLLPTVPNSASPCSGFPRFRVANLRGNSPLRILSLLHHWQVPMVHFNTTGQTQSFVSTYHAHSSIDSHHIKASPGSLLNNSPQSLLCLCFED